MYDLYLPLVEQPEPAAVIRVEDITGPILLISSKMDTMWPSERAAGKILERLRAHGFPYAYQHLSYDYGSHLFVPMELPSAEALPGASGETRSPPGKPGWTPWKRPCPSCPPVVKGGILCPDSGSWIFSASLCLAGSS